MEEDIAGPLRELGKRKLVACPRCGRPTVKDLMIRLPVDYAEPGTVVDYDVVCPQCWAELERGEEPVIEPSEE